MQHFTEHCYISDYLTFPHPVYPPIITAQMLPLSE